MELFSGSTKEALEVCGWFEVWRFGGFSMGGFVGLFGAFAGLLCAISR